MGRSCTSWRWSTVSVPRSSPVRSCGSVGFPEHLMQCFGPVERRMVVAADHAVTQHQEPIGDVIDLTETVGDIEDGDALVAQLG